MQEVPLCSVKVLTARLPSLLDRGSLSLAFNSSLLRLKKDVLFPLFFGKPLRIFISVPEKLLEYEDLNDCFLGDKCPCELPLSSENSFPFTFSANFAFPCLFW